jgi:uncharacterized protein YgiM (DUF1202 family)
MPEMRWFFLPVFLLSSGLFSEQPCAEAQQKATIYGASQASLRAGPNSAEPRRGILNQGDKITVEGQQGSWYLVQTIDGQKGYVHKSLVKLANEEKTPAVSTELNPAKPPVSELQQPNKSVAIDSSVEAPQPSAAPVARADQTAKTAPAPAKNREASVSKANDYRSPPKKSPSVIELLEGREADMIIWAGIAVAFFLIGWICGGNFYLRRDRLRRTKLRF